MMMVCNFEAESRVCMNKTIRDNQSCSNTCCLLLMLAMMERRSMNPTKHSFIYANSQPFFRQFWPSSFMVTAMQQLQLQGRVSIGRRPSPIYGGAHQMARSITASTINRDKHVLSYDIFLSMMGMCFCRRPS